MAVPKRKHLKQEISTGLIGRLVCLNGRMPTMWTMWLHRVCKECGFYNKRQGFQLKISMKPTLL